ncbi:hypothetical protein AB0H83_10000 [Dactylosporangium sp. NPDC050688]|uniref:hypothetical protein n=1 Tax=Dactylosporangium sp. NPDC050688 TaxID=3157217 RepID=UPI003408BB63
MYADDWPGHESTVVRLVHGEVGGEPVLVTSDGSTQYIWDATIGGTVWLHDPRTGRPDGAPLGPLPGAVTCLAIDADALVAGCADGTVRRWTGTQATVTGLPGPVTALAVHAGAVYAAAGDIVHVIR